MNAAVQEIPFHNAFTRQVYSAKNAQLLYEASILAGIEDRAAAGFKQWIELGRVVRKGEHGTKIYMVVDKKTEAQPAAGEEESKFKVLKTRTVFFESQTVPLGGEPEPEPEIATPIQAAPIAKPKANQAAKLRDMAEKLQSKIDSAFGDRLENTPKRRRQAASARLEGYRLQRTQKALNRLADLHDSGSVPAELDSVTTKAKVYELCSTVLDSSRCGYYDAPVDTGKPRYATSDAVALWALLEPNDAALTQEVLRRKKATVRQSGIPGFFPTPDAVADRMMDASEIVDGMAILEPSAGDGALALAIAARYPACSIKVYEVNSTLCEILRTIGFDATPSDFLAVQPEAKYDRISMNPPFERMADIDHVKHAYGFLKDGGILVSVMAPGAFFRADRKASEFREWLAGVGGEAEDLPERSFSSSGTDVATKMVTIRKVIA